MDAVQSTLRRQLDSLRLLCPVMCPSIVPTAVAPLSIARLQQLSGVENFASVAQESLQARNPHALSGTSFATSLDADSLSVVVTDIKVRAVFCVDALSFECFAFSLVVVVVVVAVFPNSHPSPSHLLSPLSCLRSRLALCSPLTTSTPLCTRWSRS